MGETRDAELFRNADWSVQTDGLEHNDTGYFIDRATLSTRRAERLWDWPLQMAEKRWCRPSLFREAFLAALDRFGVARDADLTRSFALGYGIRATGTPQVDGFLALGAVLCPQRATEPVATHRAARSLASAGA